MRNRIHILCAVLSCALAARPAAAQSGYDLFQQALAKERGEGKLADAIQIYQRIVRDFGKDHGLAAKALVQIGRDYEKLGRGEAVKAYERVVREYADQREAVAEARARMATLSAVALPGGAASGPTARALPASLTEKVGLLGVPAANGRSVPYVDAYTGNLVLYDVAAATSRTLTAVPPDQPWTQFALSPVSSADGSQVAYSWFNAQWRWELRVSPAAQLRERTIVLDSAIDWAMPFAWTPDQREVLAVVDSLGGNVVLAAVNVGTRAIRRLATLDAEPTNASLSPDGKLVVFDMPQRPGEFVNDIFVVPIAGGEPRRLVDHPANDLFPLWTPDGRGIVFRSDRSGSWAAWYAPVTSGTVTGPVRMLKPDMERAWPLGLTRDGALYYLLHTAQTDIYTATIDPVSGKMTDGPELATQHHLGMNTDPDWSPDGRFVAFIAQRIPDLKSPAARVLCILSLDTHEQREITLRLIAYFNPQWSPDGRTILVTGTTLERRDGIFLVDVATGRMSTLLEFPPGTHPQRGSSWSSDSRSVFYTAYRMSDDSYHVFARRVDSDSSAELPYAPDGPRVHTTVTSPRPSPDGQWLATVVFVPRSQDAELTLIPLHGGSPRVLWRGRINTSRVVSWSSDSREIWLPILRPPTLEFWAVSVATGQARKLDLELTRAYNIHLSSDGRRLVWNAGEGADQFWVLEHFLPAPPIERKR